MPITIEVHHGDAQTYVPRLDSLLTSLDLFQNQKGMDRIRKAFEKTNENFRFHIIPRYRNYCDLKRAVRADPDAITVIFSNNVAYDHHPLTAWMLAHRISHAIQTKGIMKFQSLIEEFLNELIDIYNYTESDRIHLTGKGIEITPTSLISVLPFEKFINSLLTMKSARNEVIGQRFGIDCFGELLAQYIITGKVRFNRLERYGIDVIGNAENEINHKMGEMMNILRGDIWVL